jgi:predicted ArsR family transcriptional regulator
MRAKMEALLKQIESGKIETDKAKILNYIINNPESSRIDILEALDMLENTATGRISDLEDLGLIMPKYSKEQRGSSQSMYVFVADDNIRNILIKHRVEAKILKAVKNLLSYEDNIPTSLHDELKKYWYSLVSKEMLESSDFDLNGYIKTLIKAV